MESDNEQYLMVMASGVNFQGLLCTSSDKVDASLLQAAGSNIFFHKSFSLGQKLQKGYSLVANSTHSIWTLQQREKTQQRGNKAKGKKQQKETKLKSWFHRVAGPQLRVVSTMSAGYDHIGKPFRKKASTLFQTWEQWLARWFLATQQMLSLTPLPRFHPSTFSKQSN